MMRYTEWLRASILPQKNKIKGVLEFGLGHTGGIFGNPFKHPAHHAFWSLYATFGAIQARIINGTKGEKVGESGAV